MQPPHVQPEPPPTTSYDDLPDVGFPLWVKAASVGVLALVLFSLLRLPPTLQASIAEARGEKYFDAGNYAHAVKAYETAEKVFPTSNKVTIPLADSYLHANMPAEAALELSKMEGQEVDDATYQRATNIGNQIQAIGDKLEKEGRDLTDDDYRDSLAGKPANKGGKK